MWPERLQIMHLLGFHGIFTTKTSFTRVRAVPRYSFSVETIEGLNKNRPTIGIMPSGLPWVVGSVDRSAKFFTPSSRSSQKSYSGNASVEEQTEIGNRAEAVESSKDIHQFIYSIPYSDHSCFTEIQDFVNLVQPASMRGIVSSTSCYIDPRYYFGQQENYFNRSKETIECKDETYRMEGKLNYGSYNLAQESRKRPRHFRFNFSNVRVKRVSLMRRMKCGARILEDLEP